MYLSEFQRKRPYYVYIFNRKFSIYTPTESFNNKNSFFEIYILIALWFSIRFRYAMLICLSSTAVTIRASTRTQYGRLIIGKIRGENEIADESTFLLLVIFHTRQPVNITKCLLLRRNSIRNFQKLLCENYIESKITLHEWRNI